MIANEVSGRFARESSSNTYLTIVYRKKVLFWKAAYFFISSRGGHYLSYTLKSQTKWYMQSTKDPDYAFRKFCN